MWYMVSQPANDARATLLEAAVDYVASNGLSDLSLRQMAAALGTSHRMLIYHFGSKEQLLVAVVNEMERRQLDQMVALDVDGEPPAAQLRTMWRRLADRRPGHLEPLRSYHSSVGSFDEVVHLYLATHLSDTHAPVEENERIEVVRWPLADLDAAIAATNDAKTLIGLGWLRASLAQIPP